MKGLQQKCLVASAFTHGLLLLIIFVGSAFLPQKPKFEGPAFELVAIPAILVDEPNVVGGGNPNAKTPPQIPLQQPITPAPAPSQPQPAPPPKPEPKPEPIKEPVKEPVHEQPKIADAKPDAKPKVDPDNFHFDQVIQKTNRAKATAASDFAFDKAQKRVIKPAADSKSSSEGEDNARAERDKLRAQTARASGALSDALKRVQGGLSTVGGSYEIPGPGGPAYASYYLALRKFYETAWIPPNAARGDEPVVEVEVVIARDGTILSQRVLKRSGRGELDRSVDSTLNRVRKAKAPAFPSGSTDEKRTFRINFNLTDKLSLG